jgi:replicative DNA helicase
MKLNNNNNNLETTSEEELSIDSEDEEISKAKEKSKSNLEKIRKNLNPNDYKSEAFNCDILNRIFNMGFLDLDLNTSMFDKDQLFAYKIGQKKGKEISLKLFNKKKKKK